MKNLTLLLCAATVLLAGCASFEATLEQANQGAADAQFSAGMSYLQGDGVKKDPDQGVKWLEKAAENGHDQAMCELGKLLLKHDADSRTGVAWLRKSAAADNFDAAKALALHLLDRKATDQTELMLKSFKDVFSRRGGFTTISEQIAAGDALYQGCLAFVGALLRGGRIDEAEEFRMGCYSLFSTYSTFFRKSISRRNGEMTKMIRDAQAKRTAEGKSVAQRQSDGREERIAAQQVKGERKSAVTTFPKSDISVDYLLHHEGKDIVKITNNTSTSIKGFYVTGARDKNKRVLAYAAGYKGVLQPGKSYWFTGENAKRDNVNVLLLFAIPASEASGIEEMLQRENKSSSRFEVSKVATIPAEPAESRSNTPPLPSLPLYKEIHSGMAYSSLDKSKRRNAQHSKNYLRFPFNHIIHTQTMDAVTIESVFANPDTVIDCPHFERYLDDRNNQLFEIKITFPQSVTSMELKNIVGERYGTEKDGTFTTEFFPQWTRSSDNCPVIIKRVIQLQYFATIYENENYSVFIFGGVPSDVQILPLAARHQMFFRVEAHQRMPLDWNKTERGRQLEKQKKIQSPMCMIVRDKARWEALLTEKASREDAGKQQKELMEQVVQMYEKDNAKTALDF